MSDLTHLTVTPEVLLALHGTTPQEARKTRPGPGGGSLTYVDARYVMQMLDMEVGPGNWQDEYAIGPGGKVSCRIGIFVEDRGWVWKGDGAGNTDIEGDKGSFSDAFKRAAVKWGIGRDLYGDTTTQVQAQASAPVIAAAQSALDAGGGPREVMAAAVAASDPLFDDGTCPQHGLAWVLKPGGVSKASGKPYDPFWTCPSTERPYCKQKPSKAFVARREVA